MAPRPRWFVLLAVLAVAAAALLRVGNRPFFPRSEGSASGSSLQSRLQSAQDALNEDPSDLKALVDRGVVYYQMGPERYAESLNDLNQAWRQGAFDTRIFYYSGILYENLSLYEESRKGYERFLRHHPGDREVRMRLARLLFRMGRWKESIDAYRGAIEKNSKDVTSLINLGLAYQNMHESKVQERRKAAAAKKASAQPAVDEREDLDQALRYLEQATQVQAEMPEGVYLSMARLYAERQEWGKAAQCAETELQAASDSREALLLLASSSEKLHRNEKALEAYGKLLELDPSNRAYKQRVKSLQPKPPKK